MPETTLRDTVLKRLDEVAEKLSRWLVTSETRPPADCITRDAQCIIECITRRCP
jgi:hypothetical protein